MALEKKRVLQNARNKWRLLVGSSFRTPKHGLCPYFWDDLWLPENVVWVKADQKVSKQEASTGQTSTRGIIIRQQPTPRL